MDANALVTYLDSHSEEYEKCYKVSREQYLRVAKSLFCSLSNCNITVLDTSKFNSFMRIMKTFLNKNEIFEEWNSVRSMINFILLNLSDRLDKDEQNSYTLPLLNLLIKILEKTESIHSKNCLDKKRILETISLLLNEDPQIAAMILKILNVILKMEGSLEYNINNILEKIMGILLPLEDVKNLCLLAKLVLERLPRINEKIVRQILGWIFHKSTPYIKKGETDIEIKKAVLSLILDFNTADMTLMKGLYSTFTNDYSKLWRQFMKISDTLWMLCKLNNPISYLAQEIFNITVVQFLKEESMLDSKEESVIRDLRLFHTNTECDQEFPEKYFFFICHMQELHCRLTWSPKTVLDGIEDWFFNHRSEIDFPVFKSLLFLYPRLAILYSKPKYIALGIDILRMLPIHSVESEVFTFCQVQLKWILKMGNDNSKMRAIRHWMKEIQLHKTLKHAIISCKSERILLRLIFQDSNQKIGRIASKFLKKMDNKLLSEDIARMLPYASKEPNVFNCLLLARPGVPERKEEKMLLLELMAIMIPSLADDSILRAACIYSNDLLENMKREPKCLLAFSKYTSTIKFLLYASYRTEEDISKEILFLFRNLVSLQVKHQFEMEISVKPDPTLFLKGTSRQINRVLTIFPIILSSKVDPLLNFEDRAKRILFFHLLNFVDDIDTQENALKCLHLLIKTYDVLSFCGSIVGVVRIWCSEQFDDKKSHLNMVIIVLWLRKLMKYPRYLVPTIPYAEIQNFFMRSGDIKQINYCSKMLRILQKGRSMKNTCEAKVTNFHRR